MAYTPIIPVTPATVGMSAAGTSITLTIPGGVDTNTIMLAGVEVEANAADTISTPAGWNLIRQRQRAGNNEILATFWRRYQAGDANPTFSWAGSFKGAGAIIGYTGGIDLSAPIEASAEADGSSNSPAAPSVTGVTRGGTLVNFIGSAVNTAITADRRTQRRVTVSSTGGSASTNNALGIADDAGMAEGATGTRTHTAGSGVWVAMSVYLKPAEAAPVGIRQGAFTIISGGAANGTVTLPSNGTAGSLLVLVAATWAGGTVGNRITSATYNGGTALTLVDDIFGPSNNNYTSIWFFENNQQTASAPSVLASRGGGSDDITLYLVEIIGITDSGALDVHTTNQGTSNTASVTTPTLASQDVFIVNAVVADQGGNYAYDSDYQARFGYSNTSDISIAVQTRVIIGGTGTDTATVGITTGAWGAGIASFKAAIVAGGTQFTQSLVASVTVSGLSTRKAKAKRLASVTTSASFARKIKAKRVAAVTASASIKRKVHIARAASVTASALLVKKAKHTISGATVSAVGAMSRKAGKRVAASVSALAGGISRHVSKIVPASVNVSGASVRLVRRSLAASVTTSAAFTKKAKKWMHFLLANGVRVQAATTRKTRKSLAGAVSVLADLSAVFHEATGTLYHVSLLATVNTSASMTRKVKRLVSGTVTVSANSAKAVRRGLVASVTVAGASRRAITKALAASLSLSASMQRRTRKGIAATVSAVADVTGQLVQGAIHYFVHITATVSSSGAFTRKARKAIAAPVAASASFRRRVSVLRAASVGASAFFRKRVAIRKAAAVSVLASLATSVSRYADVFVASTRRYLVPKQWRAYVLAKLERQYTLAPYERVYALAPYERQYTLAPYERSYTLPKGIIHAMKKFEPKPAAAVLDYDVLGTEFLEDGDAFVSATVSIDTPNDGALTLGDKTITPTAIKQWVSAGTPGQVYVVTVLFTTNGGRTFPAKLQIPVS